MNEKINAILVNLDNLLFTSDSSISLLKCYQNTPIEVENALKKLEKDNILLLFTSCLEQNIEAFKNRINAIGLNTEYLFTAPSNIYDVFRINKGVFLDSRYLIKGYIDNSKENVWKQLGIEKLTI